jgi:hypothetical protein
VAIAVVVFVLVVSRLFEAVVPGSAGGFNGGLGNGTASGQPPSGLYQPAGPGFDTR